MAKRSLPVPFLDLLFILLLSLLVLTILRQPVKTSEIEQRAEFLIIAEWDDDSSSDIDTWFRGPTGNTVYFGSKQNGLASLDRDDLGALNDTRHNPDGTVETIRINREVITLRGWEVGAFTVNLHVYRFSDAHPIKARVRIMRLNPFRIVLEREVTLDTKGQETTIASIRLDANGDVQNIDYGFVKLTRSTP